MEKYILKTINVKPNDIILIKADFQQLGFEKINDIHQYISKEFPNNKVITTLKDITDIEFIDWQKLYDYVMSIKPEK